MLLPKATINHCLSRQFLKMRLQILLVVIAKCLTLFCLTNGAPPGGSETDQPSSSEGISSLLYTPQEDDFIINEVLTQQEEKDYISWKKIAAAHESKVLNNDTGFYRKRSAGGLRKHFESLKVRAPTWKPRNISHVQKYTQEEEELINKELLNDSYQFAYLYTDKVWEDILREHNFKREQKCPGFSKERTASGLRTHFTFSMKPGRRISKEVMARFPRNFKPDCEGSSTNKKPRIDLNTEPSESDLDEEEEITAS